MLTYNQSRRMRYFRLLLYLCTSVFLTAATGAINHSISSSVRIHQKSVSKSRSLIHSTSHASAVISDKMLLEHGGDEKSSRNSSEVAMGPSNTRLIYGASFGGGITLFFSVGLRLLSKLRKSKEGENSDAKSFNISESYERRKEDRKSSEKTDLAGTLAAVTGANNGAKSAAGCEVDRSFTPGSANTIIWVTESFQQTTNHLQDDLGRISFSSVRPHTTGRNWLFPRLRDIILPYLSAPHADSVPEILNIEAIQKAMPTYPDKVLDAHPKKRDYWGFLKSNTLVAPGQQFESDLEVLVPTVIALPEESQSVDQLSTNVSAAGKYLINVEEESVLPGSTELPYNASGHKKLQRHSSVASLSSFQHLVQLRYMEDSSSYSNNSHDTTNSSENSMYAAGIFIRQQSATDSSNIPSPTNSNDSSRDFEYLGSFIANNDCEVLTGLGDDSFVSMEGHIGPVQHHMDSILCDILSEDGTEGQKPAIDRNIAVELATDLRNSTASSTRTENRSEFMSSPTVSLSGSFSTDINENEAMGILATTGKVSSQTTSISETLSGDSDLCSSFGNTFDQPQEGAPFNEDGAPKFNANIINMNRWNENRPKSVASPTATFRLKW